MKFLVVLALAAAVSAEADPWMVYNTGLWGHAGVYSHAYAPYHYKPAVYHAASPGVSHTVGLHKREAEPYYYGAYPYAATTYAHHWAPSVYAHAAVAPYGIKAPTYSNDAVSPYGYAAKGQYVAKSGPVTHVAKREAEPFYYGAYPYASVYSHAYATPYAHAVATPVAYHAPLAVAGMKTYSNDAVKPFNYAAKGMYHADSLGAKHIAKREAEPYYFGAYGYGSSAYPFVSHASPAVYAHSHPLRVKAYVKHF